ncbi:MAG: SGNH/GDSL hydrolase family protein [Gemmatimonadota bacterium]|nr:SGNH/GDSL hydrolase family protein [Gemmatimonadota bacterium]
MDRIEIGGKLLLVVASLAITAFVIEVSFWLFARSERIYPLVYYETADPNLDLWCYDEHFAGTPDWDLRRAHPYGKLTYLGNANNDSTLANLLPFKVPNAIEMRRNEEQLRERPMAEFGAQNAKIILVIGDSFGFGQGVRVAERFSHTLEVRLNRERPAERYQFFNACVPGMNIKQIAKTMERYVEYFARVERVVYSFTLNDPFRSGRLLAMEKELADFMHLRSNVGAARFLAGRNSYTLHWFAARLKRQQLSRDTVEWYRHLYKDNLGRTLTRQLLSKMKKSCADKGIKFSLVVFPVFYQLEAYPLTEVHETLGALAQHEGIHYVDLLAQFAGKDERDYWVHPTDFHPNSRAHREAGDFLFEAIPW